MVFFWGEGGGTPANVFVCVCGRGQGAEPGIGRYKNNFVFCFFSPPSPTLHFPPPPPPTPSTPHSPPPAGCLILSRFQHAVEELQVCWWNLAEKVVGPGWGSWHNKPEGNERLPLVGRVRKYDFQREFGNQREMTWQPLKLVRNYIQGVWEGETAAGRTHITMSFYGGGRWAEPPELLLLFRYQVQLCRTIWTVVFTSRLLNHPNNFKWQSYWWDFFFKLLLFCRHKVPIALKD